MNLNYKSTVIAFLVGLAVFGAWLFIAIISLPFPGYAFGFCLLWALAGAMLFGIAMYQYDVTGTRPSTSFILPTVAFALILPLFSLLFGMAAGAVEEAAEKAKKDAEQGIAQPAPPGDQPKDQKKNLRVVNKDKLQGAFDDLAKKGGGADDGPIKALPAQAVKLSTQKGVRITEGYYGARHVDFTIPGVEGPGVKTGVFCHRHEAVRISTPTCLDVRTVSLGWRERGGQNPVHPKAIPSHEFSPPRNTYAYAHRLNSLDHAELVILTEGLSPGSYRFTVKPLGTLGPGESAPGVLAKRFYK